MNMKIAAVLGIIIIGIVLGVSGCIEEEYTVTYAPGDHGTFSSQTTSNLTNGTATPKAPAVIGEPGYDFNGWSPSVKSVVTENVTYTAQWVKVPPSIEITSKNIRTDISGLHYYTYVDVSVHNYGGDGNAVVWTTVYQGNKNWTKSQPVYLNGRGTQNLMFTFIEPSLWDSNTIKYSVWVENQYIL
ncbi:hypothetical protein [Methanimicrococcus stummii]|nr:hypothetical protein [Methanimicrococcus sp. Es2]